MKTILFLISSLLLAVSPAMGQTFPALQGKPLLDAADIVPDDQEAAINGRLNDIATKSGHQVMVFTTPSLDGQDISQYGVDAARHYAIGNRDSQDGVFVTIAPKEHKARIDTGYGIESLLTDAETHRIQIEDMVPHFKEGDWVAGINGGIEGIAAVIVPLTPEQLLIKQREKQQHKARMTAMWDSFTGFLFWVISSIVAGAGAFGLFKLAGLPKRRRLAREAEEARLAREAQRKADEEARQIQYAKDRAARLARERAEAKAAEDRQAKAEKAEQDRQAAAVKAREDMLAAMTEPQRLNFLDDERIAKEEEEKRQRELARKRAVAAAIAAEAAAIAAAKQRVIDNQREEERRKENARQAEIDDARRAKQRRDDEEESSRQSSSSSYDFGGGSSSSSSDFSGGGGSFGGGGSDSSW